MSRGGRRYTAAGAWQQRWRPMRWLPALVLKRRWLRHRRRSVVPGVTTDRCRGRCHRRDEERTTAKFFFTLTAAGRPVMANVFFCVKVWGIYKGFVVAISFW